MRDAPNDSESALRIGFWSVSTGQGHVNALVNVQVDSHALSDPDSPLRELAGPSHRVEGRSPCQECQRAA